MARDAGRGPNKVKDSEFSGMVNLNRHKSHTTDGLNPAMNQMPVFHAVKSAGASMPSWYIVCAATAD
jgi:hypothetical protein